MELWVLFGTFTLLLAIGTPVAFCLGVSSFATVLYLGLPPVVVFQRLNSGVSVFALMAITMALLLTGNFDWERLNLLLTWGPILLLVFRGLSFFVFRTYLLIVRYVGEKDYKNVFYAVSLSSGIFFIIL